jgi:large subunit ribosomal protein L10
MGVAQQPKSEVVQQLSKRFVESGGAFLVDYQGCTCTDLNELRLELGKTGASFAVVKNTLAKKAIAETENDLISDFFKGPTAVVWIKDDPVTPAKIISKFAKDKENFSVKGGIVEGKTVDVAGVEALSTMPSKEQLYAQLLALINAPATQLVRLLNAPATQVVRLLDAWKTEKEKQG